MRRRVFLILFVVQSGTIFLLVHFGRYLEGVWGSLSPETSEPTLLLLLVLAAAAAAKHILYTFHAFSVRAVLRDFLACAALFAGIREIVEADAEWAHLPLYGALYVFARLASPYDAPGRAFRGALLLCMGVNICDELLQGLHPERFFAFKDLLLNLLSALFGAVIIERYIAPTKSQ